MTSIPTAVDLVVIGGGINGCGIARDAAGRGLSVLLCERDDLAAHTSSASTKLIHGGLRYLEYYEFRLVRKALQEREVLLRAAPHIIWPLRFVMPHDPSMRPEWMIRCGLFLYDHLARRELLAGSEVVTLANHPAGAVLADGFTRGYVYSDGWVDDARLVALCALDAFERGATVLTQTECVGARRSAEHWDIDLRRRGQDQVHSVRARAVINAAGPWVAQVLAGALQTPSDHHIRLVKGSHIIVPKLFDHAYAYIFQNPDKRIIFAIPYQQDFTLIGTTDIEYRGDPGTLRIDQEEVDYLCAMASRYFRRAVTAGDVVHTYSGVRPLLEDDASDASAVTRDYWLELNSDAAPVVSVFGGKITTFRRLSEEAMDLLLPVLGTSSKQLPDWTAHSALPGGDMVDADFSRFLAGVEVRYPWLPAPLRLRYARAYGTRMDRWLNRMTSMAELGDPVAPGVYAPELTYLRDIEWARTGQDVLWRRSKLGLHLTAPQRQAVTEWMATHPAPTHAAGSVPASMQQEIG